MQSCPRCGFHARPTDAFCGSCGLFLVWLHEAGSDPAAGGGPDDGSETPAGDACARCLRFNPAPRRFCGRCGDALLVGGASIPVEYTLPQGLLPWWRRPWWRCSWWREIDWPWRRRPPLVFDAGERPGTRPRARPVMPNLDTPDMARARRAISGARATAGRVIRWSLATTRRVWPDVLISCVVVVLLALLVPPVRKPVLAAYHSIAHPPQYIAPSSCVEPPKQAALLSAYPAAFVCDNVDRTYWVTPVGSGRANPQITFVLPPAPDATGPFAGRDVGEFHLYADQAPPLVVQAVGRPAQIQLDFYSTETPTKASLITTIKIPGTTGYKALVDASNHQSYQLQRCVSGVRAITLTILRTFPASTEAPAKNLILNGVQFYQPYGGCPPPH